MLFENIILASASPRRAEILSKNNIDFQVHITDVEELEKGLADELVKHNAELKSKAISELYPDSLIIAADTVVLFNDKVLGKPKSRLEAEQMLLSFSGKKQQVFSGVSLIWKNGNYCESWVSCSEVFFKNLTINIINSYFEKVDPLDKAGAYNVGEYGEMIIEDISGLKSNIIGLPIEEIVARITSLK